MKKVYDEKGKEIKEFSVIRVFHYIGPRRKKEYMYKWVRILRGQLYGIHLCTDKIDDGYPLWVVADPTTGYIEGTTIVQDYSEYRQSQEIT